MPVNPDMDNGLRPVAGQKVRIVGRCHPRLYRAVVEVVGVTDEWVEIRYLCSDGEYWHTSGTHGGHEPVPDDEPLTVIPSGADWLKQRRAERDDCGK